MKLLTKLVIGIESALTSGAYWLWNTAIEEFYYVRVNWEYNFNGSAWGKYVRIIYPYQPLAVILLGIVGIIGFAFIVLKVRKNREPMPDCLKEWIHSQGD